MIPFSEQIKMIRGGELDAELSEKLAECVTAVDQQGGTATLTIKISVKRSGQNTGYFKVSAATSTKLPKVEPMESILYGTQDGTLWEDNPKQKRLFDGVQRIGEDVRRTVEKIGGRIVQPVEVPRADSGIAEVEKKQMK